MYKLVIAEKPSLAKAYVAALGGSSASGSPQGGYWAVGEHLITYAFGHLFEVCQPSEQNAAWEKWTLDALPMIPDNLRYKPSAGSIEQWKVIKSLIARTDVVGIINGCDAGREGELIFRLIYDQSQTNKPSQRLWVSSLTAQAILTAFGALKDGEEYDALSDAAYARQEADWLIGMNATRCQTMVARSLGGNETFSLGRVQTPVLALIVKRDLLIENFKSVNFFGINASFQTQTGAIFNASLIDEEKKVKVFERKPEAENSARELGQTIAAPFIEHLERKTVSVKQPLLFDITALQREMNKGRGWTAAKTLEIMQSIYEKKLATYPRTDSAYLTEDDNEVLVPQVLSGFNAAKHHADPGFAAYQAHAAEILKNDWKLTKRHVDNGKVTDHHAIIPTGAQPDGCATRDELDLYQVIAERFLAAFYPVGTDEKTEIIVNLDDRRFLARGKKVIKAGWREISQNAGETEADGAESPNADDDLPEQILTVEKSDRLTNNGLTVQDKKTNPPPRYNEDTILAAMQTAGKTVADDEARQAMKELGIGRPGTRAEIIEKLVKVGYIERKKKSLISTAKGRKVIEMLGDNILTSAELTGKWEAALNHVAEKRLAPARYREGVRQLTIETVNFIKKQLDGGTRFDPENLGDCPKCVIAGRKGKLKGIISKEKAKYLVCTTGRDHCDFISGQPKKKSHIQKMIAERCPKCAGAMVFRLTKTDIPFLSCSRKREECDGVKWIEQKAPAKTLPTGNQ